MLSPFTVLSVLWVAWVLSWLVLSGWASKAVTRQSTGSRITQSLPIWIGAFLLFGAPVPALAMPLFPSESWIPWVAVVLAALGFALTWWARLHLGKLWSAAVTLKEDHSIVGSGPYAYVRHPIYTGILVGLLATAIARNTLSGLLGVGFVLLGFVLKLRQEEEFLTTRFGAEYLDYKKHVPALIPGRGRRVRGVPHLHSAQRTSCTALFGRRLRAPR